MQFKVVNILDMIEVVGEEKVQTVLSQFSCTKNPDFAEFVRENAIDFAKRKISISYLVYHEDGQMVAVFAVTHKSIELRDPMLNATTKRKLLRYATYDEETNTYTLSAFLIAQFGKNSAITGDQQISGNVLMDNTFRILRDVQRSIGGGVV